MNKNLNLEQIIEFMEQVEYNSFIQICDSDLIYKFVGNKFVNLLGVPRHDIINNALCDFKSPWQNLSAQYFDIHQDVLANKSDKKEYITYLEKNEHIVIVHNRSSPIFSNSKIIGLYIKSSIINPLVHVDVLRRYIKNKYFHNLTIMEIFPNKEKPMQLPLNQRDELILYFIMLGKVEKEIANILSSICNKRVSRDAVSKLIVRNLYPRFKAASRSSLIINTYSSRYFLNRIPHLLFINPNLLSASSWLT